MSFRPIHLGVNVDHVATVRQARGTRYPDPVTAALIAEQAGADSITMHLREDRRHIQARDRRGAAAHACRRAINLEMAVTDAMVDIARQASARRIAAWCRSAARSSRPKAASTSPGRSSESRPCAARSRSTASACRCSSIPTCAQIDASAEPPARRSSSCTPARTPRRAARAAARELERIRVGGRARARARARRARRSRAQLPQRDARSRRSATIVELNIGHAIVAQALFDGFAGAVAKMKALMVAARS